MPYLPDELPNARVLITVKTYPLPSRSYTELVCTAGLLNGEKWIRMYPIPYRFLQDQQKYPKYSWIELNLTRKKDDFRPESYSPKLGVDEPIKVFEHIGTANEWAARKSYVLKEVFTSMSELIALAKDPNQRKSLATLKPPASWILSLKKMNASGNKNGKTNSSNSICLNCQPNEDTRNSSRNCPTNSHIAFSPKATKNHAR
jgi:hypothetical protein